jgi:serine protease Do
MLGGAPAAMGLGLALCAAAGAGEPPATGPRVTPVVRVFRRAQPAVVNLSTTTIVQIRTPMPFGGLFDEIFDFPAMPRSRNVERHSVGSGFLIHGDGYLVTNAHVVDRATEVKATFADGRDLPAKLIAIDRTHDLAVLQVEAGEELPHLKLGRSDDLMPGETVVAIGNPLGLQHTVTAGIISALDRDVTVNNRLAYRGLIQTDASINPGNSGGPLLNILGELIGINTAIRGDAQNIGFAIPVSRLGELLPEMLDVHRLRRLSFGIRFEAGGPRTPGGGVRVKRVDAGSPAARAGVQSGDVITAIERIPTPDFMEAFSVLARARPGRSLRLEVDRGTEGRQSLQVRLAEITGSERAKLAEEEFGFSVRAMTREDLRRLRLRHPIGLIVESVRAGGPAAGEGVQRGDILTTFGGYAVTSREDLHQLLEQVEPGDEIPAEMLRLHGEIPLRGRVTFRAS